MVASTLLLTSQDGITKWLTGDFHPGEIMVYRGLFAFPVLLLLAHREGGVSTIRSRSPAATALRSILAFTCSVLVITSFVFMPLAEALAIIFVSPVILTALAGPLLGEHVGWRRWCAVGVGFTGVLLMTRPGDGHVDWTILLPIGAAIASALRDVVTRRLGGRDSATSVLFWTMALAVAGGAATLPFGTELPDAGAWGLFLAAGLLVTFAHWLQITALHLAPAAIVAPFRYLSLVWATIIGYAVWGDVPDPVKAAGAVIVVCSGLYIIGRESGSRTVRAARVPQRP